MWLAEICHHSIELKCVFEIIHIRNHAEINVITFKLLRLYTENDVLKHLLKYTSYLYIIAKQLSPLVRPIRVFCRLIMISSRQKRAFTSQRADNYVFKFDSIWSLMSRVVVNIIHNSNT